MDHKCYCDHPSVYLPDEFCLLHDTSARCLFNCNHLGVCQAAAPDSATSMQDWSGSSSVKTQPSFVARPTFPGDTAQPTYSEKPAVTGPSTASWLDYSCQVSVFHSHCYLASFLDDYLLLPVSYPQHRIGREKNGRWPLQGCIQHCSHHSVHELASEPSVLLLEDKKHSQSHLGNLSWYMAWMRTLLKGALLRRFLLYIGQNCSNIWRKTFFS